MKDEEKGRAGRERQRLKRERRTSCLDVGLVVAFAHGLECILHLRVINRIILISKTLTEGDNATKERRQGNGEPSHE